MNTVSLLLCSFSVLVCKQHFYKGYHLPSHKVTKCIKRAGSSSSKRIRNSAAAGSSSSKRIRNSAAAGSSSSKRIRNSAAAGSSCFPFVGAL